MEELTAKYLLIRGIVQGVGFRPTVYNYATQYHLNGWVRNTSRGVEILIQGKIKDITGFIKELKQFPPPLARIDEFTQSTAELINVSSFSIHESQPESGEFMPISPDIAICSDCQHELFDASNRRYLYPFINCTNCGPRFTIIKDIPYDRPFTTMSAFQMCNECREEYEDPKNRRFHAQPIACPACGPQLRFERQGVITSYRQDALNEARLLIKDGGIVTIKGLGGYLIACDAANVKAINRLREAKHRIDKPFALMTWDSQTITKHAEVNDLERSLLQSHQKPIVLLNRKDSCCLPSQLTPNQNTLGFMLPYTPLHLLLLKPSQDYPEVLVMTSGNLGEEPIAYEDDDARKRLSTMVDGFLMHDRDIHMRTDDSVARIHDRQVTITRRARGFAPDPISLPFHTMPLLASGAQLKNTFCLTRDQYGFISHHIGDLENYETLESFEKGIDHFQNIFHITPESFACDLHPDYLSSQYARNRACSENKPIIEIQHHHAHLAACLADNQWTTNEPVIGFCFDGTGYGTDGAIWGGEVLWGGYEGYERILHLAYLPLPGGDVTIHKPARMALTYLHEYGISWDEHRFPAINLSSDEKQLLKSQLTARLNTPDTSSMGRLFDAVSALTGICQTATYEGQAAVELETIATPAEYGYYSFLITEDGIIEPRQVIGEIIIDMQKGLSKSTISAKFHNSIAQLVVNISSKLSRKLGCKTIALSGGVWQNKFLLEKTLSLLSKTDFKCLIHRQVPCNDGGISLGQAVIASTRKL